MVYKKGKGSFYIMKKTGIVRRVDELGRIVIPKEIRQALEIKIKESMEIYIDGNFIILKKVEDSCIFCGKNKYISEFNDKIVCAECIQSIVEISEN